MSKKEKKFPEMRKDRTYAYVRQNGEKIMLDKWDSPHAQRAYNELYAKWLLNPSLVFVPAASENTIVDSLALAFQGISIIFSCVRLTVFHSFVVADFLAAQCWNRSAR